MDNDRLKQIVVPFYLNMMCRNSLTYGAALLPAIADLGRTVSTVEVVDLLSGHWRPRVMGPGSRCFMTTRRSTQR